MYDVTVNKFSNVDKNNQSDTMSEIRNRSISAHIATKALNKKLDDLESRAICLDKQLTNLLLRAGQLEDMSDIYAERIEKERKVASIVQLLMHRDSISRLLLDYSSMFFEILLRKSQAKGVCASSVRELWQDLSSENTERVFSTITKKLGFTQEEHDVLTLVFEIIHQRAFCMTLNSITLGEHMTRRRSEGSASATSSIVCDSDVSSVFLYLQIQEDLHKTVASTFRRVVAVAHCGLVKADKSKRKTCGDVQGMGTPEDILLASTTLQPEAPRSETSSGHSSDDNSESTVGGGAGDTNDVHVAPHHHDIVKNYTNNSEPPNQNDAECIQNCSVKPVQSDQDDVQKVDLLLKKSQMSFNNL